jgi:peptidyl-tRNA hydrolase
MLDTTHRSPKKLFILVRRDLSCGQKAVQACHALAELMRNQGNDP